LRIVRYVLGQEFQGHKPSEFDASSAL
jgi:hypothetical protein